MIPGRRLQLLAAPARVCLLGALTVMAFPAIGDPPELVRYQSILADDAGVPLTGTHDLRFDLYTMEIGGTPAWTEQRSGFLLEQGILDVLLGDVARGGTPLPTSLFSGGDLWLQVSVDGTPLVPRQRLASVPYSLAAERLGTLTLPEVQADMDARIAVHAADADGHPPTTRDVHSCPAGMVDLGVYCIDLAVQPVERSWKAAIEHCQQMDARLCHAAEIVGACAAGLIDGTNVWSADIGGYDTCVSVLALPNNCDFASGVACVNPNSFRCCQ
jgi:hypothetical protein